MLKHPLPAKPDDKVADMPPIILGLKPNHAPKHKLMFEDETIHPGYPMAFDLATKGLDEAKAKALAHNIGQMAHEKNKAGFLLLQSLPIAPSVLRKAFIEELNKALTNTGWKIAEDDPNSGLMTLYNSNLYELTNPKLNSDVIKPNFSASLKDHKANLFEKNKSCPFGLPPVLITNAQYTDDKSFNEDWKAIDGHYAKPSNFAPPLTAKPSLVLGGSMPGKQPFCFLSESLKPFFDMDKLEFQAGPSFNHPNTAVYHLSETLMENSDLIKGLSSKFTLLSVLEPAKEFSKENIETMAGESHRLSLFTDVLRFNDLIEAKETGGHSFEDRLIGLINLFRTSATKPKDGWKAENVPTEIRLAVPIWWPDEHFSPLCLKLTVDPIKLAGLINSKSPLALKDIKECFIGCSASLYESTLTPYLSGTKDGAEARKQLEGLLKGLFVPEKDKATFKIEDSLPLLQRGSSESAGADCAILTAAQAENFLEGNDSPLSLPLPEGVKRIDSETDSDLLRKWNKTSDEEEARWTEKQQEEYAENSRRFLLKKRREHAINYGIKSKPEQTKPEQTTSETNTKKSKADLWNEQRKKFNATRTSDYLRLYKEFLETHGMKETGNKVIKGLPASNENAVFEFQKSKDGGMEITLQGKATEEKIEAMLLKHLANGHDPERDELIITTSRPGLYLPFLEKYHFKNVSFSNATSAAPATPPPQDMASLMKGMGM